MQKIKLMQNNISLKYYSFFVHINPSEQVYEWGNLDSKTQQFFIEFINQKDYGDLLSTTFNFLIEKEIDIDKEHDNVSLFSFMGIPPSARLTLHLDYKKMKNSSEEERFKITANGILFMLKHWQENLKTPKNNYLPPVIGNYSEYLKTANLLLPKSVTETVVIKIKNPFRFTFMRHYFQGLREKQILFDTNDIERFLNNHLYKTDFGESINRVYFSYDIFDFENPQTAKQFADNEKKYQYGKNKDLSFMEQYDSNRFLEDENYLPQTKFGQLEYLKRDLLTAVLRIKTMQRKPKDFNVDKFYAEMDKLMTEYNEENK